jgi:hypothetical protein
VEQLGGSMTTGFFTFNPAGAPTILDAGGNAQSQLPVPQVFVNGQPRNNCALELSYAGAKTVYLGYRGSQANVPVTLNGRLQCGPEPENGLRPFNAKISGQGMGLLSYGPEGDGFRGVAVEYNFFPRTANPLDHAQVFVREQYESILNRAPDQAGLEYWTNGILECGADAACVSNRRIDVSAAFFVEGEFQSTGLFYFLTDRATLGGLPPYQRYVRERPNLATGSSAEREAFLARWVQLDEFTEKYPAKLSPERFVAVLVDQTKTATGVDLSGETNNFVNIYKQANNQVEARARVLRLIVENPQITLAEYDKAFVLMQYFGYLQRDPDAGGYEFWLRLLTQNPRNYRSMVCAFITSAEYQRRFSPNVTRDNGECQ